MTPTTPEHLQLLSDKHLDEAARDTDAKDAPDDGQRAMARAARYEQRRRHADVPVNDRYGATH